MKETILFIDDEENILAAFRRQLKSYFDIQTGNSAAQGLALIKQQGPFAVVVADMRMPEMNGIDFLATVKNVAPDSVRMMLTGNADQTTAIDAINKGNIFRFLTKPCQKEDLVSALEDAIRQYQLITTERVIMEKTLMGSINIMTEILEMVNPSAFSQATRIRALVRHLGTLYKEENLIDNTWQVELAAMLCNVGCVTLPAGIVEKINHGEKLSEREQQLYNDHPRIGAKLTESIPRLEVVSRMVLDQHKDFVTFTPGSTREENNIALGAQFLKIAKDYDLLTGNGLSHDQAMNVLSSHRMSYNPHCLDLMTKVPPRMDQWVVRDISLSELRVGMVLNRDLLSRSEKLLMARGTRVTQLVLERLINYDRSAGVQQPFSVRISQVKADQNLE